MATVLVLAGHEPAAESACARFLASHADAILVEPVPGPPDALFARMCAAITRLAPSPPLVIVAIGSAALALPSIALAQRSGHRRTVEYLLIEPSLPAVSDTWPDAPVTVACDDTADDASVQGRLRGWTVLTTGELAEWRPQQELS